MLDFTNSDSHVSTFLPLVSRQWNVCFGITRIHAMMVMMVMMVMMMMMMMMMTKIDITA